MQQTTKYQFNLVDATDDFSPAPLNQNAQKMEDALEAHAAAVAEQLEDMDGSMAQLGTQLAQVAAGLGTGGHTCRIAWGSYTGTGQAGSGNKTTLTCDFTPVLVMVRYNVFSNSALGGFFCVRGASSVTTELITGKGLTVTWGDNSVSYHAQNPTDQFNQNKTYYYVLLGYSAE